MKYLIFILLISFICIATGTGVFAQSPASRPLPSILEKTRGLKVFPGFFNFYWDENTGKIWLAIDKMDKDILYQPSLTAGADPSAKRATAAHLSAFGFC